ncbi:MAG: hypothetical protein ACRD12_21365 [Acidimicrobiales bacterium]
MDTNTYMNELERRMHQDGWEISEVSFSGGRTLAGFHSRWKFVGGRDDVRMHIYVFAQPAAEATAQNLEQLVADAWDYGKRTHGKFRGLDQELVVVPGLIAERVTPEARAAAETRPKKEWGGMIEPVVVDLTQGDSSRYTGAIWFGGELADVTRDVADRYFVPAPSASGYQPSWGTGSGQAAAG